jgi:hypothetical protein
MGSKRKKAHNAFLQNTGHGESAIPTPNRKTREEPVNVRFFEEELERLDIAVEEMDATRSEIIRTAVEHYLDVTGIQKVRESRGANIG